MPSSFLVERTMAPNVFGCPVTSLKSHKDAMSNKAPKGDATFHSCGIWIKASYINHSCLGNVRRSFIGDMMIVRACKDLEAGTEIVFPYTAPRGDYTLGIKQKFKSWGFICSCALCEDIKSTKPSAVAKRRSLFEQLDRLCKSGLTAHNAPIKFERLVVALNETYQSPAEQVPRLLLLDPQLLLTRVYMEKRDLTKVLESVAKTLQTLGFIVAGLDPSPTTLIINKWGHIVDDIVEVFLHGQSAFEQLGIWEKSKQAEQYAKIAYRILVGEEASFNRTWDTVL